MGALLLAVPGKLWGYLAAAATIAVAVFAALAKARSDGVKAAVAAQAQSDMEAARARIDQDAMAARVTDPVSVLRQRWGR